MNFSGIITSSEKNLQRWKLRLVWKIWRTQLNQRDCTILWQTLLFPTHQCRRKRSSQITLIHPTSYPHKMQFPTLFPIWWYWNRTCQIADKNWNIWQALIECDTLSIFMDCMGEFPDCVGGCYRHHRAVIPCGVHENSGYLQWSMGTDCCKMIGLLRISASFFQYNVVNM